MKQIKNVPESVLNDINFCFNDYFRYVSTLGRGSFGFVILALSKDTLEYMAVKVMLKIVSR